MAINFENVTLFDHRGQNITLTNEIDRDHLYFHLFNWQDFFTIDIFPQIRTDSQNVIS